MLWVHEAKKTDKWCLDVLEAAERPMARWHEEVKKSSEQKVCGGGRKSAAKKTKKGTADRVERHQAS